MGLGSDRRLRRSSDRNAKRLDRDGPGRAVERTDGTTGYGVSVHVVLLLNESVAQTLASGYPTLADET
jgi:hypothetical protein